MLDGFLRIQSHLPTLKDIQLKSININTTITNNNIVSSVAEVETSFVLPKPQIQVYPNTLSFVLSDGQGLHLTAKTSYKFPEIQQNFTIKFDPQERKLLKKDVVVDMKDDHITYILLHVDFRMHFLISRYPWLKCYHKHVHYNCMALGYKGYHPAYLKAHNCWVP